MIELFVCEDPVAIPRDYFIITGENCSIYLIYDSTKSIEERLNDKDALLRTLQTALSEAKEFSGDGEVDPLTKYWIDYLDENVGNVFDRVSHVTFLTTLENFEDACHKEPRLYQKDSKCDPSYQVYNQYTRH